jgi:hypothetical protein
MKISIGEIDFNQNLQKGDMIIRKGKFFTFHASAIAKIDSFNSEIYFILIDENGKKVMFTDDEKVSLVR